jgi:hypothetical protein
MLLVNVISLDFIDLKAELLVSLASLLLVKIFILVFLSIFLAF